MYDNIIELEWWLPKTLSKMTFTQCKWRKHWEICQLKWPKYV